LRSDVRLGAPEQALPRADAACRAFAVAELLGREDHRHAALEFRAVDRTAVHQSYDAAGVDEDGRRQALNQKRATRAAAFIERYAKRGRVCVDELLNILRADFLIASVDREHE